MSTNGRLQGRLEVSRAFGDRQFKKVLFPIFLLNDPAVSHFLCIQIQGNCVNYIFQLSKYISH